MGHISQQLSNERQMLGRGRRMIESSGERLALLLKSLSSEEPKLDTFVPEPPSIAPHMLDRAAKALLKAGYPIRPELLLAATRSQAESGGIIQQTDQTEDLRLIEAVGSGHYRCNVRRGRGKRRLIPEVFGTVGEARAARDALELLLRMVPTPRNRTQRGLQKTVSNPASAERDDPGAARSSRTSIADHGSSPVHGLQETPLLDSHVTGVAPAPPPSPALPPAPASLQLPEIEMLARPKTPLQEQIERELKVLARGRETIKKAEARLAILISEVLKIEEGGESSIPPAPPPPMDEARRKAALAKLRAVGYVPKIKYR